MIYSTGEISPDVRWKPFRSKGEIETNYIWGPWVPLGNVTGW